MLFPFTIMGRRSDYLVIDFSKINMRERPKFILRNLDGKAIGFLGHKQKYKKSRFSAMESRAFLLL